MVCFPSLLFVYLVFTFYGLLSNGSSKAPQQTFYKQIVGFVLKTIDRNSTPTVSRFFVSFLGVSWRGEFEIIKKNITKIFDPVIFVASDLPTTPPPRFLLLFVVC
jgi:hypothetical protein